MYADLCRWVAYETPVKIVVGAIGIEPTTFAMSRQRSNQLSYAPLDSGLVRPVANPNVCFVTNQRTWPIGLFSRRFMLDRQALEVVLSNVGP